MPKTETIFTREEWVSVHVWQSHNGNWNATGVKDRGRFGSDGIKCTRGTKEDAIAALNRRMDEIDREDRAAAKVARETLALADALGFPDDNDSAVSLAGSNP